MDRRTDSIVPPGRSSGRLAGVGSAILLAVLAGGCENDDAVLGLEPMPPPRTTLSLRDDIQPIFSSSCARAFCHGSPPGGPMSLEPGDTFVQNVGVPSCEAASLRRVEPGNSGASYLVIKLEGTQSEIRIAGGCVACDTAFGTISDCGVRMPLGDPPLPDAQIQLIRRWIDEGAPDN